MKETGQILKAARTSKNISLNEVWLATKINIRILEAIEEGRIEDLPSKAFVRGFVKSYSKFLELNEKDILDHFHQEMGSTKPKIKTSESESEENDVSEMNLEVADSQSTSKTPNFKITSNLVMRLGLLAVLIAAAILIVKLVKKYERESKIVIPKENITQIPNRSPINLDQGKKEKPSKEGESETQAESSESEDVVKEAKQDNVPQLKTQNTMPTESQKAIEKIEPVALNSSNNSNKPNEKPEETAQNTSDKHEASSDTVPDNKNTNQEETREIPKELPPKKVEASSPSAPKLKVANQELIIEALDKVNVEVNFASGEKKNFSILPEEIRTIKIKGSAKVTIDNGGAVSIIQNGTDKGVPGNLGQPITLNYN